MEASIREPNIKHFVRLLQCASRYGDDLCMHATRDSWELAVTNSSKSAFCLFTLWPSFFAKYRALGTLEQQRRGVRCKLYAKSVLGVLGKASSVNAVERIHLKIIDPEGGLRVLKDEGEESEESEDDVKVPDRSAMLEIKLVYHHGITKKHFLHLQSSDFLRAIVDVNSAPCGFQIAARVLRDWLDHFSIAFTSSTNSNGLVKGDSHLAWRFCPKEVRVKNFENINTAPLMTEINIDVGEFQDYEIESEQGYVDLALPMREFKATLQLAEQFNMDLDFFFSEATQPLAMSSRFVGLDRMGTEMQLFSIFCVIATTTCDAFGPSPPASVGAVAASASGQASAKVSQTGNRSTRSESRTPVPKRKSDGGLRSSRPRASLSLTAHTEAPPPSMVSVVMNNPAAMSQRAMSQKAGADTEPLFLPGASQTSVRMTQAEVLEMAGMDESVLDAMMDDVDAEEAMGNSAEERASGLTIADDNGNNTDNDNDNVPTDWSEIDFGQVPPNHMSTQRNAMAAAQETEEMYMPSPPRKTEPLVSAGFELDEDIFGAVRQVQPERERNRRSASKTHTPKPPTLVPTEIDEDEELDPDPLEPTQPDGRKYTSLFDD